MLKRRLLLFCFALFFLFVLSLIPISHGRGGIVIGSKNGTESEILSEIFAQLIERKSDLKVRRCFNLEGTAVTFKALETGAIDLYPEYTGAALLSLLKETTDEPVYSYVKRVFKERFGIDWLAPLGFSSDYVLLVDKDSPFEKFSDLGRNIRFALDPEFIVLGEWELIKKTYFPSSAPSYTMMEHALLEIALAKGGTDVISGYSSSIGNFKVLEDDKGALPSYEACPIIRESVLARHPELKDILKELSGKISLSDVRRLNNEVEREGRSLEVTCSEYLDTVYSVQ